VILVQSLKEAKDISKGKAKASRRFEVSPADVKVVREQIGLSKARLRPPGFEVRLDGAIPQCSFGSAALIARGAGLSTFDGGIHGANPS